MGIDPFPFKSVQWGGRAVPRTDEAAVTAVVVAAVAAAWYGGRARPAIRHLMRGWARYASAR